MQSPHTLYTVVIINWNSWDYLFPCLDALSRQTLQEFRIVVVDNASSDQGPASRLRDYPQVTSIRNAENIGFAAANNQAIERAADSEWIVLLNPDTLPEKKWLESLCQAAADHPEFSFFGSRLVMADNPKRLDGTGDVYHMSGLTWRSGHGLEVSAAGNQAREIFSPCAAAAMYRRQDLLAIGGFDEDFFCYNEDVDLGFRLRLAGLRALSVPDAVVLHYGSGTTAVRSDFAVYHGHRNLVWSWFKNMPGVLLWLFFPAHVIYNIACILLYVVRGQGAVILRAKWDAVKGLLYIRAKRKKVQSQITCSLPSLWKIINKCLIVGPGTKHKQVS